MRLGNTFAAAVAALLAACGGARKVDAVAASGGVCTACHGGLADASGAPPFDTQGRSDTTLATVGAHVAHVRAGLDCASCHPKPTAVVAPRHADGRVDVDFGPLATANGALAPVFDEASGACSNVYCHGAFRFGRQANVPRWTHVGEGEGSCGTCHAIPPPASTGHPQIMNCGGCHPGYTGSSVNRATHLDGRPEVGDLTCTSCHGDAARTATPTNPQLAVAPPFDSSGNTATTAPGVGAHQAHLTDGALRPALACTQCHAVPASLTGHPTGATDLAWDPLLAATRGASPVYAGGACASTYCHGATLNAGGTNHAPSWTGGPSQVACGTCHAIPPPRSTGHPAIDACERCHPGYTRTQVNLATHVNGRRELVPMTCTSCHGDPARAATALNPQLPAAPPTDASSLVSSAAVGAHLVHLNGSAISAALACTQCHTVPSAPVDLAVHPAGVTTVPLQGTLASGAVTATINSNAALSGFSVTTPSYAGGACSATYCHGAYSGVFTYAVPGSDPVELTSVPYAGSAATPTWSGAAPCGSCHGAPPADGRAWHGGQHGGGNDCSLCHPDAAGTAGSASITDASLHVDGKLDLAPRFTGSCFGCH